MSKKEIYQYLTAQNIPYEVTEHKAVFHPNDNTATVWLQADNLLELIRRQGNPVSWAVF